MTPGMLTVPDVQKNIQKKTKKNYKITMTPGILTFPDVQKDTKYK